MGHSIRYFSIDILRNKISEYQEKAERLDKIARRGGSFSSETKFMADYYRNSANSYISQVKQLFKAN